MTGIQNRLEALLQAQTEHPVYPRLTLRGFDTSTLNAAISLGGRPTIVMPAEEVVKMREQRELRIAREKSDRFRHRCEPEMWKRIDLMMARKRIAFPGVQLELLVMGGVRGSKTDFTHSRAVNHFFYTNKAWVWGLHETQPSSKTIQQARVVEFFPPELNPESGKFKKDKRTRMQYSEGGGFTGDAFTLHWKCQDEDGTEFDGGGLFDFKFYRSTNSSLQGSELTCAVSDELIPLEMVETVRERLLSRAADTRNPKFLARIRRAVKMLEAGEDLPGPLLAAIYHGVHLIGFTPKEGYSATVGDFLDGAVTTVESTTHVINPRLRFPTTATETFGNIPVLGISETFTTQHADTELIKGKWVPRFKQPKKPTRLVAYLHTSDNAHKGNWEGQVQSLKGATEDYIRIIAYGDVSKGWSVRFAKWNDTVHTVTKDWLKDNVKDGTWYHIIDPHGERMWFMLWALVSPTGIIYIVRESPLEGDFVPDVGDPGPWAVTSKGGFRNGDAGDAQQGRGWGLDRYVSEIKRIEAELSEWWGKPINVEERIVDSRGGQDPTIHAGGKSTVFDDLVDRNDIEGFMLALGSRLSDGDQKINDCLDHDLETGRAPRLFVVAEQCPAVVFMFQTYGNPLKPKDEACKEPRDCIAYLVMSNPEYITEQPQSQDRRGRAY
jgi:hypothetical protein